MPGAKPKQLAKSLPGAKPKQLAKSVSHAPVSGAVKVEAGEPRAVSSHADEVKYEDDSTDDDEVEQRRKMVKRQPVDPEIIEKYHLALMDQWPDYMSGQVPDDHVKSEETIDDDLDLPIYAKKPSITDDDRHLPIYATCRGSTSGSSRM